jgi:hypothetical protein
MLIQSRWCESFSVFILYLNWLIKPISNQGLACYKCMTLNPNDEECSDPFSSINSPIQINCQVRKTTPLLLLLLLLLCRLLSAAFSCQK